MQTSFQWPTPWKCGCLIDREVVEFVERLSASFKMRNGQGKWVHRQVCNDLLPHSILKRKKRGFAVNVVDEWFKETMAGKFKEMLTDSQSLMFAYLKTDSIKALVKEHVAGRSDNHKILFSASLPSKNGSDPSEHYMVPNWICYELLK